MITKLRRSTREIAISQNTPSFSTKRERFRVIFENVQVESSQSSKENYLAVDKTRQGSKYSDNSSHLRAHRPSCFLSSKTILGCEAIHLTRPSRHSFGFSLSVNMEAIFHEKVMFAAISASFPSLQGRKSIYNDFSNKILFF